MTGRMRVVVAVVIGALGFAAQAAAQATGMPLFTNPRYSTGLRVHADIGQPADSGTTPGKLTVIQGGVTFALGPIGIGANIGALRNSIKNIQSCTGANPLLSNCDPKTKATLSALLQLRVMGGGLNPLSLSLFGGASTELGVYDVAVNSGLTGAQIPAANRLVDSLKVKEVNIPLGAALGLHIPLGLISVNLWGAPRFNLHKYVNCGATNASTCGTMTSAFRWAVGADIPIFSVLSLRAAFDSGKVDKHAVNYWGVGASIGLGGMR